MRLVALACVLACASAAAAPHKRRPPPVPEAVRQAKALYDKGIKHYEIGEHEVAIVEFKRAYELSSSPGLLFNIAQCYRLAKKYDDALQFYHTYLRLMPNAPNRADVEGLIAQVEKTIKDDQDTNAATMALQTPPPAQPPLPTKVVETPIAPPPGTVAPPAQPVVIAPQIERARELSRARLKIGIGIASLVVGAGALGAGAYFGARATSDSDEIERLRAAHAPWDAHAQQTWDDGKSSALIASVLYAVGGVAIATGGLLTILGARQRHAAQRLALVPTVSGGGMVWSCAF